MKAIEQFGSAHSMATPLSSAAPAAHRVSAWLAWRGDTPHGRRHPLGPGVPLIGRILVELAFIRDPSKRMRPGTSNIVRAAD